MHIVDDDKEFRASIRWLIESADKSARPHASAAEFLGSVESDAVGCPVTELRMPGMSRLELQRVMNLQGIRLPINVMTAHGELDAVMQAMKEGAMISLQLSSLAYVCDHATRKEESWTSLPIRGRARYRSSDRCHDVKITAQHLFEAAAAPRAVARAHERSRSAPVATDNRIRTRHLRKFVGKIAAHGGLR